jgi:Leucine-rich repeat (LRR) protein
METLIISNNKLDIRNNTEKLFNVLTNLKFLNLSSNSIEIVRKNTFLNLFKLRLVDLSNNKIYSVQQSSFNGLTNLRDLYLNQNQENMTIEKSSFIKFDAIKTIFVDKSILNDANHKLIFIDLVKKKNMFFNKTILNRSYFHAFYLIALNDYAYDCELVFELLRFQIEFNLKTESDYYNYLAKCQNKKIK